MVRHLGYTQDNYVFLLMQIEEMALTEEAIERPSNEHGRIFQVDLQILGNYEGMIISPRFTFSYILRSP